jgi:prepilin signal peptidase PulO-like enzyme (type II secretory pathway)
MPRTWYARHGWRRALGLSIARLIRDRGTRIALVLGLLGTVGIAAAWRWATPPAWIGLESALVGMAASGGLVWMVRIIGRATLGREAMGFGDVTLMAMIGAFLGTKLTVLTIFAASVAGSLFGLSTVLGVWIKRTRRNAARGASSSAASRRAWQSARLALRYYEMPFGVFLGSMGLLAFFYGNQLLRWYLRGL